MCRCGLLTIKLYSENRTKILKEKEGWVFNSEYLYIKENIMSDLRKFIKTTIREYLNENINSNKKIVYHGGRLNNSNIDDLLYVSFDKEQAKEYAKGNDGDVHIFELDMRNIISEDEARNILIKYNFKSKEEGWDLENELNLYEILDPNFSTSLSDYDLKRYFNILKSNHVTGIQFTDMDIITLKNGIQNILIIDKSVLKKI